jgi:hypothetical protein
MAQVLKKNILSIVCGVVVIVAIAAYFFFVRGLYDGSDGLEANAAKRKAQYDQLAGLISKQRTLPVVELNKTDPVPLDGFPVPAVIEKGTEVTKQLKDQSDKIVALATQLNRRQPLVPGIFPNPTDPKKFMFRDFYEKHINNDLPAVLHASAPPSEQEVQEAREKLWRDKYQERIIVVNGREANREQVDRDYLEEIQGILEQLEAATAKKIWMYIEKETVNKNPAVASQDAPPTEKLWYAQTALWVQEDVCAALAQFNEEEMKGLKPEERNVTNAPVKHLITLQVPQDVDQYIAKSSSGAEGESGPGVPDYKLSPTGRNSNSLYDVVKFSVVCKADARYVARLVQALGRGRFITIHKVNLTTVDSAQARADGFVYGTAPIVQVQMTGEALLMREWTKPLVPDSVKKHLPQFEEPAKTEEAQTAAAQ